MANEMSEEEKQYDKDKLHEFVHKMMEELAIAPKEDFGKRQPGERCAYEIQRIENARTRD